MIRNFLKQLSTGHDAYPTWAIASLIFVFHGLLVSPWIYVHGAGEPDSNAMLAGIYQAILQGSWFGGDLYMLIGQPMYYAVAFIIQGLGSFSYDGLALALNILAMLFAAGSSTLVFLICRQIAERPSAILAALVVMSSSTVLELSTYTHPVSMSICFMLLGCYGVLRAFGSGERGHHGLQCHYGWLTLAVIAGAMAVSTRADIAILLHLYGLLPLLAQKMKREPVRWKTVLAGWAAGTGSLVCGMAIIALIKSAMGKTAIDSTPLKMLALLKQFFNLMPPLDGFFELAFGFGVAGSLLFLVLMITALLRRQWVLVLTAALLIGPPLVFAMGNVQPARRWLPAIYAMALASGVLWQAAVPVWTRFCNARTIFVGLTAIVINVLLLPLGGRALSLRGVPVADHVLLYRAVVSVREHHRVNQQYLFVMEKQMDQVRKGPGKTPLILGSFAHVAFLKASYCRAGLPVVSSIADAAPGYFLTKLEGEGHIFYIAECMKNARPPRLEFTPDHMYQMVSTSPPGWDELAPLIQMVPKPADSFRMWVRRP